MRGFVLLITVAVAVAQDIGKIREAPFKAITIGMAARLDSQEARINFMADKLSQMTDRVSGGEAKTNTAVSNLKAMNNRLDGKYGDGCITSYNRCGSETAQCVAETAFCDGIVDCANGGDEAMCGNPMTAGSKWLGTVVYDKCTSRKPKTMMLSVNSYDGNTGSVSLAINSENARESTSSLLFSSAAFNVARKTFTVVPPESDGLGVNCVFLLGRQDRCLGFITRMRTGDRCAAFIFDKQ